MGAKTCDPRWSDVHVLDDRAEELIEKFCIPEVDFVIACMRTEIAERSHEIRHFREVSRENLVGRKYPQLLEERVTGCALIIAKEFERSADLDGECIWCNVTQRPDLFVELDDSTWHAVPGGNLVQFRQEATALWVDASIGCLSHDRVLGEVAVDRDAATGRALIDMVVESLVIAPAIYVLEQLFPMVNSNLLQWNSVTTVKANLGFRRGGRHGAPGHG